MYNVLDIRVGVLKKISIKIKCIAVCDKLSLIINYIVFLYKNINYNFYTFKNASKQYLYNNIWWTTL